MRRIVAPFAAVLVACSAILDFEDLSPLPLSEDAGSEAAPGSSDAATITDAASDASRLDASADGSCNANFTNDPKHCGRCNHDCLSGTCKDSTCEAFKIADGLAFPEGLVVDDTNVFVAEWGEDRIARFGKNALGICNGDPIPTECIFESDRSNVFFPTAMGIDQGSIYWANGGQFENQVRSCPRAGCGGQAAKLIAALGDQTFGHLFGNELLPLDLVVKQGHVFWPESQGGAIRSAPVDGGTVTTYLESGDFMPVAIAVDDANVFFTDDTNQHATQIASVPRTGSARDGGAVRTVTDTPARPFGLSLTAGGDLYWSVPFVTGEDGLVQNVAKTSDGGAGRRNFANDQIEPHMLITDESNAYWLLSGDIDNATGIVVYCPLTGCPASGPIVLAKNQRMPLHLTQDDRAIYWSNEGLSTSQTYDGQVWKVAKP